MSFRLEDTRGCHTTEAAWLGPPRRAGLHGVCGGEPGFLLRFPLAPVLRVARQVPPAVAERGRTEHLVLSRVLDAAAFTSRLCVIGM